MKITPTQVSGITVEFPAAASEEEREQAQEKARSRERGNIIFTGTLKG
jgi:hypothetical protein